MYLKFVSSFKIGSNLIFEFDMVTFGENLWLPDTNAI